MTQVLVSSTTMSTVRKELAASLLQIARQSDALGYQPEFCFISERPYEHAMNILAASVARSDFEWWLHFDDDQAPLDNPLRLLASNPPLITGFPTAMWNPFVGSDNPVIWMVFDEDENGKVRQRIPSKPYGVEEVSIVGSGAMLIHRSVVEKLESPFACNRMNEGPDFAFCRAARRAGFSVHADFACPCHHFVNIDMLEISKTWSKQESHLGE